MFLSTLKFRLYTIYNQFKSKMHMKKSIGISNPLYQTIGNEFNLGEVLSTEVIQSLWSGYGELVRLHFANKSIIIKHVKLPEKGKHPKGWNTNISHQRKIHSYKVETNWYENYSLEKDVRCRIPKGLKTFQRENEWLIVMEDLVESGFVNTTLEATENHLKSCLYWLANFHAKYIHTQNDKLWKTGTYWHLETRSDELEALDDRELKKYAKEFDEVLKQCTYQTIVHGDAKLANFCFNEEATVCAAVDFQYVGQGCAMKDVVYFMSSAVSPKNCEQMQTFILDTYFEALHDAIEYYQPQLNAKVIEQQWRPLFTIAWADFQRFIKGWSPNHYKINAYTETITQKAISELKMRTKHV